MRETTIRPVRVANEDEKAVEGLLLDLAHRMSAVVADGHLSILYFSTNVRVGFHTPESRGDISRMAVGETLTIALDRLLRRVSI